MIFLMRCQVKDEEWQSMKLAMGKRRKVVGGWLDLHPPEVLLTSWRA